jgi:hypothetical protein
MAYEICGDILGAKRTPVVQRGGSMFGRYTTAAELKRLSQAALKAAVVGGQQAEALFVSALLAVGEAEWDGDWPVLPDLIFMLSTAPAWMKLDLISSDNTEGWLSTVAKKSLVGALKAVDSAAAAAHKSTAVDLMLLSCAMPDKPLDITEVDVRIDVLDLGTMCFR